jgi:ribosome recycling factor
MTVADPDLKDLERRMHGAVEVLQKEFAGLRTGRASIHLLEPINVEAYGSSMPLNQVATISVPEPRMITVQVWDRTLANTVDKAIRDSGLGLNPQSEGQVIRVPIPMLSEERRVELGKIAGKYAEQARVAIRNVRRDGMETLKQMERDHEISQDELHLWSDEIQELTDGNIKQIDETLAQKETEIMQV